jgi:hypothetical protein
MEMDKIVHENKWRQTQFNGTKLGNMEKAN